MLLKKTSVLLLSVMALIVFTQHTPKPHNSLPILKTVYDFKLKTIDGNETTLAQFKGKKMLLVNVASKCGFTPQYHGLQELHNMYKDKLVIIGFPANNFGGQEPAANKEIQEFCKMNFGVTFLMMEKISVKGDDIHPLYKWLGDKNENGSCSEVPDWNFCKYLIDEKGSIIKFFKGDVDPLSGEITKLL